MISDCKNAEKKYPEKIDKKSREKMTKKGFSSEHLIFFGNIFQMKNSDNDG